MSSIRLTSVPANISHKKARDDNSYEELPMKQRSAIKRKSIIKKTSVSFADDHIAEKLKDSPKKQDDIPEQEFQFSINADKKQNEESSSNQLLVKEILCVSGDKGHAPALNSISHPQMAENVFKIKLPHNPNQRKLAYVDKDGELNDLARERVQQCLNQLQKEQEENLKLEPRPLQPSEIALTFDKIDSHDSNKVEQQPDSSQAHFQGDKLSDCNIFKSITEEESSSNSSEDDVADFTQRMTLAQQLKRHKTLQALKSISLDEQIEEADNSISGKAEVDADHKRSISKEKKLNSKRLSTAMIKRISMKMNSKRKDKSVPKTELIDRVGQSEYKILHGLWMQGDFYVLITHDSTCSKYYLELYQYECFDKKKKVFDQQDRIFLFETMDNVTFDINFGEYRQYVSIFVEINSYQTREVKAMYLYLLDSDRFKVSQEVLYAETNKKIYQIAQGLRKLTDFDIPKISQGFSGKALKTIQMFAYSPQCTYPELFVFFQQFANPRQLPPQRHATAGLRQDGYADKVSHQLPSATLNTDSKTFIHNLFSVSTTSLYPPKHKKVKIRRISINNSMIEDVEFQFLDKEILGVFRLERKMNIIVYADGCYQQYSNPTEVAQQHQLILPFKRANRCFMTMFNNQHPMIIFTSKYCEIVTYVLDEGVWTKKFTLKKHKYQLQQAFGPFMVGTSISDQTVKLLELGGKHDNNIVTEMSLGSAGQTELQIDAYIKKSNFAVLHENNSTEFIWYKFDQQRQLHHMKSDTITQVCDDFLIEFNLVEGRFSFSLLDRIEEGEVDIQLFEVSLSKHYQKGLISSFVPVINPSKTFMVLQISYGRVQNTQWLDEKFQGLILVDLHREEIYQPSEAQPEEERLRDPFKQIVFKSDLELLCQNSQGIFLMEILFNDGKPMFKADELKVGSIKKSRVSRTLSTSQNILKPRFSGVNNQYMIKVQDYKVSAHFEDLFLLGTRDDKILVFSVSQNKIQSVNEKQVELSQVVSSLFLEKQILQRQITGMSEKTVPLPHGSLAANLTYETLATVQYPQHFQTNNTKFQRWSTCMNQDQLYVLLSNNKFAWVYEFEFNDENPDGILVQIGDPHLVSQEHANAIYFLNKSQLAIQSNRGLCIFNIETKKIDWKVKFIYNMNVEFTVSQGYIAIPRSFNGVLLEFGMKLLGNQLQCNEQKKKAKKVYPDLNHILVQFRDQYKRLIGGYLCINERLGNWESSHKLMPINYHYDDYIRTDVTRTDKIVYDSYIETEFLCLAYNNNFTIWEALIRKGLLEGKVQITDSQIERICNPYLGNDNNSLLHKMCFFQTTSLKQVFENTTIADRYGKENKRYLFFQNFKGESQLDIALKEYDFESFEYLIEQMILLQNCFESTHLVDSWLIDALKLGLNIKPLFESEIMSQKITRYNFQNADEFDHFHTRPETKSHKFQKSIINLQYSETVYLDLFGKDFESKEDMKIVEQEGVEALRFVQSFREMKNKKTMRSREQKYAILYYVDHLFPTEFGTNELKKRIELLNEHLSKITNLDLFNAPMIQRYIDFQWESKLIWVFKGLLFSHVVSCILIMINIGCLDFDQGTPYSTLRETNNIIVAVIVMITVPFFEIRQMMREKWGYFTDFWNINDITFCVILATTITADFLYDTTRTKAIVNPLTGVVLEGREVLEVTTEVQFTRICYALLAISSFIKLLSLLRIYNNISFIIQMLQRVAHELTPFLFLFMCIVGTFSFVVVALDMQREDLEDYGDPYQGLGGIGYYFFVLRTSFGDFSVDPFKDMPQGIGICMWIIWLLVIFCNTIIFLNFIIAVISDSYEQIMDIRIEELYKKKAQLLADIQSVFGENSIKNANILVTRTCNTNTEDIHWNGFVSEVKKGIKQYTNASSKALTRNIDNAMKHMVDKQDEMQEQMQVVHSKLEKFSEMQFHINKLHRTQSQTLQHQTTPSLQQDKEKDSQSSSNGIDEFKSEQSSSKSSSSDSLVTEITPTPPNLNKRNSEQSGFGKQARKTVIINAVSQRHIKIRNSK